MRNKNRPQPDFFSPQVESARRFYLDLNPPHARQLTVVCGGVEHCAPDYAIRRQNFPFHSIEYVVHGEGRAELGSRHFELGPGSVFSYAPGVSQTIVSNHYKPLVKYFVDFAGQNASPWLADCKLPVGHASRIFPPTEIQPLFDELIRHGQRTTRHTPELCRRLLECLGLKLLEARAPLKETESLAFATYQQCRDYIHAHFRHLRTLQQIAADCHLDTAYVCRLFRRFDDQTPYQFLMRLKMNAAAAQLAEPGALVKNVAADLGFANPFHFSRAFKSVFAVSPEVFRRLR